MGVAPGPPCRLVGFTDLGHGTHFTRQRKGILELYNTYYGVEYSTQILNYYSHYHEIVFLRSLTSNYVTDGTGAVFNNALQKCL